MNKFILFLVFFILIIFSCTKEIKAPVDLGNKVELITSAIGNITSDSAKCGGTILNDGQEEITKRGVCWSIYSNPTLSDEKTVDGSGIGNFSSKLTGLSPYTDYFVRAYATNIHGTIYGNQVTFRTLAALPSITTNTTTSISYTTATARATINSNGGSPIYQSGVCYSKTNRLPDTINSAFTRNGSFSGTFSSALTGLTSNTKYYVRAYAKNGVGISYANNVDSFTTLTVNPPTLSITCPTSSSITQTTVSLSATVTNTGGAAISQTGFLYSTNSSFTNSVTFPITPATTPFSGTITGLNPGTTYYIKAFAINSVNPSAGYSQSYCIVTTLSVNPPTAINSCGASSITTNSAVVSGNVTSTGGAALSQVGIIYSSSNSLPTVGAANCFTSASANLTTGPFSVPLSGLNYNTTYYYRTYAKNNVNGNYGYGTSSCIFTTNNAVPPTITNNCSPSNITTTTATISANITSDGGAPIVAAGICYSASNSVPSVGGTGCLSAASSTLGVGVFSINLTGLASGTTYYYRSYTRNNASGTYTYGLPTCNFTTVPITAPIVQNVCPPSTIGTNSATVSGIVVSDGGATITQRGICYSSTTSNPIIGTSSTVNASTLGTGTFSVNLTGLTSGVTYYYRTYAKNNLNANYGYGSPVCSFTTIAPPSVSTTCPTTASVTSTTAIVGGVASGTPIGQRGICYSTTTTTPTTSSSVFIIGTGSGSFSSTLTGLSPCTTYYIRAFAINSNTGLPVYGQTCTFTTSVSLIAPTQTEPANAANLTSASSIIWFTWNTVPCATSYRIQISRSSTFNYTSTYTLNSTCGGSQYPQGNTINQATVTGTNQFCINSGGSTQNGIWYWRVQALNGATAGPWSTVRYYNYTW